MQVVLIYLEWFWRNSVLKCALQPKIAKNSLKTPILGFKVVQGHMGVDLDQKVGGGQNRKIIGSKNVVF